MRNKSYILLAAAVAVAIIATNYLTYRFSERPTIVYFDASKLFQKFKMSKETQLSMQGEFRKRTATVDSLDRLLQRHAAGDSKEYYLSHFIEEKENLELYVRNSGVEASKKIWSRVDSYARDFAQLKDYKMIISSDEHQGVIYGQDGLDITDALVNYMNERYEGLN